MDKEQQFLNEKPFSRKDAKAQRKDKPHTAVSRNNSLKNKNWIYVFTSKAIDRSHTSDVGFLCVLAPSCIQ
jgi:hypothetical protein